MNMSGGVAREMRVDMPCMKPLLTSIAATFTLGLTAARVTATEIVILPWNQTWDYYHSMGTDPAVADSDFNATWFQKAADFAANYNGPVIGGPAVTGNPADIATFDSGSGAGPLGYGAVDYFGTGGAEVMAFGTALTTPNSGSRYSSYFRTTFTATQTYTSPRIRMILDDGALIYLDGVLVARVNKSDNTEGYMAFATDTTATLNETGASSNNEACVQTFPLSTAGAGTRADSFVIVPVSTLAAGEHTLAVSVRNNANTSSDVCMAMELLADDAGISAVASNVTRQENGPGFADDTFKFDVVVTALNLPAATSWTSNNAAANGPTTGSYAPAVATFTYPAQVDIGTLNRVTITFSDATDPLLTTTVAVTAPEGPAGAPLVLSAATPTHGTGFEEAGMGLGTFSRRNFHTEMGFSSTGAVVQDVLANLNGSKMLSFAGIGATMTTEAVRVDPSVKGIKSSVTLRTYTNTTTGFEVDDTFRVSVESSPDGVAWTDLGSVLPTLNGVDPAKAGLDHLLVKAGPGTPGLPVLRSRLGWIAAGNAAGPSNEALDVPSFTVPGADPVQLEFTHRYSFEFDGVLWDGGAVMVSINDGAFVHVPGTQFTQNGYVGIVTGNHVLKDLEAFNGDSAGYSEGKMIKSVLTIPGLNPGDTCKVQFLGAWDEFSAGSNPNWEINAVKITSGAATLFDETFTAGNGALTGTIGWVFDDGTANPGPSYYTFSRSALPVPAGHQFVRMKVSQPANVALSTSEFILIDHLKLEVGLNPLADADSDGVNNGLEDLAGTSLTDPLSAFKITETVGTSPDNPLFQRATLAFPAPDFRTYRFQCSDDLITWTDLETHYGDPAVPELILTGESSGPQKFWRISVNY